MTEAHSASGAGAWPGALPAPRRPGWRSPAALAGTLAVLLVLGGGGLYLARPKPAAKAAVAAFLRPPGCSTAAAAGRTLAVPASTVKLRYGNPFGIAVSRNGRYVFASNPATLSVLIMGPNRTAVQQNDYYVVSSGEVAKGLALTSDGRYAAIAVGNQINVQGTAPAEQGASTANAANLVVPGARPVTDANDVALSPGNRYAFVVLTNSNELAVFNLAEALTRGQTQPGVFVGTIRLGFRPTQMAVSPDGRWLYVVSQGKARPAVPGPAEGLLSVLNLRTLETRPASALVAQAAAGCSPAGVAVSPDGTTVWVAARGSNELLAFSAARLRTGSPHALTARVRVGQAPTAVVPVDGGRTIVVADANLSGQPGGDSLAVVSARAALARKPALIGYIPSGRAPFRFALAATGRYLYVSDSRAAQIQIIDVSRLPALPRG